MANSRTRSSADNRVAQALLRASPPPRRSFDLSDDPLALVIAAINALYDKAVEEHDEPNKMLALLLLTDVAKRRKELGMPELPMCFAHLGGEA